ncbi:unnamed protein product [Caenorhabditis auriculariae]|uniref:C-type lectin domain-containing protein n=1 Tax=Caenorhabditis auriculariae TaxID=2777116 RepID=A0A8S1HW71_9PELO|nr:unnamed protein product [Caenorhabditis auriculariae]
MILSEKVSPDYTNDVSKDFLPFKNEQYMFTAVIQAADEATCSPDMNLECPEEWFRIDRSDSTVWCIFVSFLMDFEQYTLPTEAQWSTAEDACVASRTHLTGFEDLQEYNVFVDYMNDGKKDGQYFIGAKKKAECTTLDPVQTNPCGLLNAFTWFNGVATKPLISEKWAPGSPNFSNGDCVAYVKGEPIPDAASPMNGFLRTVE